MRPKSEPKQVERELFQLELEQIIDAHHPLVRLGKSIDWRSFEQALEATYHPTQGAPGTPDASAGGAALSEVPARSE